MEKKLEINAEEAIYLLCKESSLILDGKADIQGTEVKLEGLIKGPVFVPDLPPVPEPEDPPPPQLPPPPEKKKGFWDKMLDGVQVALDVVDMIPGVGEIADLTNAAIYTARGDYTNAALSAAAAIPFAGWAATGAKFVNKGSKALKAGAKYGDEAIGVAKATQKAGDVAANTAKFAPSPGKVKTAARKIEEIKEQFSDIQKMKDTMKGMAIGFAVGASQEMVLNAGLEALSEVIDERYAMAIGMVLGLGGGGGKKRGGGSNGIASGGGSSGGSGGGKPRKDKDGKPKDTPAKDQAEQEREKIDREERERKEKEESNTEGTDKDLLSSNGKFKDSKLESDYEKYLARKTKEGKTSRDRLDWKEEREYWLNDSPMARGNSFNSKSVEEKWYRYNEIHLSNGKRLDSYNPIKGEIVSRKATDLDSIDISTFESYLKELKSKYSAGTTIRSNKYPDLDGQPLTGKQIFEIPSSNKNFSEIQKYIDLAKNKYGIELRFREE